MPLAAGRLNRRVELQRREEEADASGQNVITYSPVATVAAMVEPVGGSKGFGEQQFVSTGDLRFTVRWRKDLTPLHRVIYDGVAYDVQSVAEAGNREGLLIIGRGRAEKRKK